MLKETDRWERRSERLPYRQKWKTKEERGGVGGRENRATLLNSSAGVQRGSACTSSEIFNNPWEGRHTHTYTESRRKHARTRVHWLWHFLSAPLFPSPSSPSHQKQQDSLPAWGNERSWWREEDWGGGRRSGGKRKKADAEAGSLTQPPLPITTTMRGRNLNSLSLPAHAPT